MGTFLIENSFGNVDTDGSLVLALHKVLCRQDRSDSYLIAYERTGNGNIDVINDNGTVAFPGWVRYAKMKKKKKSETCSYYVYFLGQNLFYTGIHNDIIS